MFWVPRCSAVDNTKLATKLGFYCHCTSYVLEQAIATIRPPVIVAHAQDASFWRKVRESLAPDSFIVGRIVKPPHTQAAMLQHPLEAGRACAEEIVAHEMAGMKVGGRPVFDAWMGLNEAVPGPQHFLDKQEMQRQYAAWDKFHQSFVQALRAHDLKAVVGHMGAGNFEDGEVWLEYFPNTLGLAEFIGFHEYGWPSMDPAENVFTSCTTYRGVMEPIRRAFGDTHRAIVTECGLARAYKHPQGGDVGWQYPADSIAPVDYAASLRWYNAAICEDRYVLGAAVFQVGCGPGWETFEMLGTNVMEGWAQCW